MSKEQEDEIRKNVLERMDVSRDLADEELSDLIQEEMKESRRGRVISLMQREKLTERVFNSLRKLDVLQELLEDEEITEIMVNGPEKIFYEKRGGLYQWDKQFSSVDKLEDIIQQIAGNSNRMVNESSPIVDTRLSDGSRVNIVLHPIALDGSMICIRKFSKEPLGMRQLLAYQSISEEAADFLKKLVRLETRNANAQGTNAVSMRDLIKTALRMRPDRIIVGECRGAEALDMLQAMNTGHDGSLSTGHANSARDMLSRLETMVLMGMELPLAAIRGQIASGIDIFVHLGRMRDRSRKVLEIAEVDGIKDGEIVLHPLFLFRETGHDNSRVEGVWEKAGELKHKDKLYFAGE